MLSSLSLSLKSVHPTTLCKYTQIKKDIHTHGEKTTMMNISPILPALVTLADFVKRIYDHPGSVPGPKTPVEGSHPGCKSAYRRHDAGILCFAGRGGGTAHGVVVGVGVVHLMPFVAKTQSNGGRGVSFSSSPPYALPAFFGDDAANAVEDARVVFGRYLDAGVESLRGRLAVARSCGRCETLYLDTFPRHLKGSDNSDFDSHQGQSGYVMQNWCKCWIQTQFICDDDFRNGSEKRGEA